MCGMPVDIMYGMPVDISDILKQGQRYVEIGEGYPQTTLKIPKDGRDVCFGYQVRLEISRDISWLIWVIDILARYVTLWISRMSWDIQQR